VEVAGGRQIPIRFPDDRNPLITHTAYGIWANGKGSYTIAGGSGEVLNKSSDRVDTGKAYLIDYDSVTGRFSNYTTFAYRNRKDTDLISHFEGIYRTKGGNYRLPATSVALNKQGDAAIASVVRVRRNGRDGFKARARWRDLDLTRSRDGAQSVLSTGNSLSRDVTVGLANYLEPNNSLTPMGYVAQGF
jgi:hypothetical protein